ncbi:hypothetical protein CDCA_CDCA01G0431 [Cyanidium caldarium]|uniref:Uncharacterized protein n=1 Tax=Cyanidium caldarium TaxID=2771 RepID=A0AAV9IQQ9_CYACA|nr:hypothetical protein CDCA_CDCA01G0431 [Cyanidium caldarium]
MRDGGGSTERTSARQPSLPKLLTYAAGWPVYALGICCSSSGEVARLAIGSFVEDASGNGLQVVDVTLGAVGNESASSTTSGAAPPPFVERHRVSLALPPTAVQWEPTYEHLIGPESCQRLAVAGDRLRLWQVSTNAMQLLGEFSSPALSAYAAPLTAMDWNEVDRTALASASIDTTVTVWDVAVQRVRTQLIAHDNAVYDVCFDPTSKHIFASCGADGSVRLFDLRSLEHSNILFETDDAGALLRLCWNRQDHHYLLTQPIKSPHSLMLDTRMPAVPLATLAWHTRPVHAIAWSPSSAAHLATAGGDGRVLLWEVEGRASRTDARPFAEYAAPCAMDNLAWSPALPDWLAAVSARGILQMLKI